MIQESHKMDYNSQMGKLHLPEYGRNIQNLVRYTKNLPEKEARNRMARNIITIMGNMHPHLRDIHDFKHKLWDHLFIMADFDLDIDSPYPTPLREILFEKPKPMPYNIIPPKYKYHGKIIEQLINKAAEYPDGDEKLSLVEVIANHLKKSYLMWNKEVVSDEIIFNTIKELSGNRLVARKEFKLTDSKELFTKNKKRKSSGGNRKNDNNDRKPENAKRKPESPNRKKE
jgi:hypothetical protein